MLLEKELSGFGIRLKVTPGFGIFMQKWGVGGGGEIRDWKNTRDGGRQK